MATTNKERRKVYLERKEQGLCPRCGKKKKKSEKYSYCDSCREKHRAYFKEVSEEQNKLRKEKYNNRIENGQCPRCGKRLGVRYTNKICKKCLEKQYSYNK